MILSACYMLWMYQRMFFGRAQEWPNGGHGHGGHGTIPIRLLRPTSTLRTNTRAAHARLNGREWAAILPLIVMMVWMGVAPQSFLPPIGASNAAMLATTKGSLRAAGEQTDAHAQETAHAR